MIEPTTLPSTVDMEIGGVLTTLPLYGTSQDAAEADDEISVVPAENALGTSVWTGGSVGDWSAVGIPNPDYPGAVAPGARPGQYMGVMSTRNRPGYHQTFYQMNDYDSYQGAFENELEHKAPGVFPVFLLPFIPLILKLIVVAVVAIVLLGYLRDVLMYAVMKSTEETITKISDDPDNPYYLICEGSVCEYFNAKTGKSSEGPEEENVLTSLLMPVVIVAAVGIGGYALIKIIGAWPKKTGG